MSIRGICPPLYSITCDGDNCDGEFRTATWFAYHGCRSEAAEEGWQIRPNGGAGSRSAPDLCPDCKAKSTTR